MADQTAGVLAGVAGASSVALGAFGAHALKEFLRQRNMLAIWETGVHYHMAHSLALLAAYTLLRTSPEQPGLAWATRLWAAGICLFSGSLYGLCLGAPKWTGAITPIAGWGCIIYSAVAGSGQRK